jgi:quercetin dioxygenase-like cupin family protein
MIERLLPRHGFAAALLSAMLVCAASSGASAQDGVDRRILLRHDLDLPGREAVQVEVTLAPGAREGRHTHAGTVVGYVLEGDVMLEMDGAPPRALARGDSFLIEPGRVHEGINRGSATVRVLAVFVVEKGKPLTTPAP